MDWLSKIHLLTELSNFHSAIPHCRQGEKMQMSSNVYVYTFFPIPRHGKPSRTLTNIKLLQSQHKDKIIFLWKEASFSVSRTAKKKKFYTVCI